MFPPSPQCSVPARYARLHYALGGGGKETKPTTNILLKVPNLFQDLTFLISARLTADGRQAAFRCLRFRPEAERRTLNLEPRTLNQEGLQATQSHHKATPRPYCRHILGIDSGVQSHTKATPRLHQSHTKAPPKPHQGSTKATPKPGKCGPTTRRWGRTRAVTLTGGEAAHVRTATSRRLDLPSGRALRPPSGHPQAMW